VVRWSMGALAALALVSGCTTTVAGTARSDPNVQPPPRNTSVALLGDVRTVDACDLLEPGSLSEFGSVQPAPPESFDYCRLDLTVGSAKAALRFGELEKIGSESELLSDGFEQVRGVSGHLVVYRQELGEDACTARVVFGDDVTLTVGADTYDSPDQTVPRLCELVDEATSRIVARLEGDQPVEHVEHPPNSIAGRDACAGLRDETVAAVLGQAPEPTTFPARHQCRWGESVPSLSVRYVRGQLTTGGGVTQETIAGRATAIIGTEAGDRALCLAETKAGAGDGLAQVIVRLPAGQLDAACRGVRTVAEDVWSELPG
jgi:hypothetical protein